MQYKIGNHWYYTHRRVAEKKLGGPIWPGYEVHHINGIKTDNRPSNLTVIPRDVHRAIHGSGNHSYSRHSYSKNSHSFYKIRSKRW